VIGDSFSIGAVPHALHYTTLAEGLLGDTEVLNLGISGVGPAEYEALLCSTKRSRSSPTSWWSVSSRATTWARPRSGRRAWMGALSECLDARDVLIHLVPARLARIAEEREQLGTSRVAISQGALRRPAGSRRDAGAARGGAARSWPIRCSSNRRRPEETFLRLELSRLRDIARPRTASTGA
jgi:hypothetical protein